MLYQIAFTYQNRQVSLKVAPTTYIIHNRGITMTCDPTYLLPGRLRTAKAIQIHIQTCSTIHFLLGEDWLTLPLHQCEPVQPQPLKPPQILRRRRSGPFRTTIWPDDLNPESVG